MKNKDLSIFIRNKEFIDFTYRFNLNVIVRDGTVFLLNQYINIYIYMTIPFDFIPIFLIYNRKESLYSTVNSLIFLREKDALTIYAEYDKTHNIDNIDKKNSNDMNIERQFIVNINILSTLFSELFEGNFSKYNSVFKPLRDFDKNIIKRSLFK
jgi:hypothetical protein